MAAAWCMRRIGGFGRLIALEAVVLVLMFSRTTSALRLNYTSRTCSTACESINCDNAATLRYGKYCGIGYTGCAGQAPCDGLDRCCMTHDHCIGIKPANYANRTCSSDFKNCVEEYLGTIGPAVFRGSNCTAMVVESTLVLATDETQYHFIAPGSAPYSRAAGAAPVSLAPSILLMLLHWNVAILAAAMSLVH